LFFMDVGTVLTVWYNKIPHCQNSSNRKTTKYHTVRPFPTSMKNNNRCWKWPDSVVFCCFSIGTVLTVWYCVVFLLDFGTVLTVNRKTTKYHTVRTLPIEK
jgi:hypothetical protein